MNAIRQINAINKRELEQNVSDSASWHFEFRDTSYIYIGQLPLTLNEHDIVVIFSQYGSPTHVKLVREKPEEEGTLGQSRGFAYLKYEDSRSCVLAIDNLNGVQVLDRNLKIDHTYFKLRDDEREDDYKVDYTQITPDRNRASVTGLRKKLLEYNPNNDGRTNREDSIKNKEDSRMADTGKDDKDADYMATNKDDEFKDPMADYIARTNENEFKDPMADYIATNEDEFKDPMADYIATNNDDISKEKTRKRSHHHRHHRSSRESKRSRHSDKQ